MNERPLVRGWEAPAADVDHITPVLFGGGEDERNLQALCAACNLSKGER